MKCWGLRCRIRRQVGSEAEVGESAVCFGHLVHILLALEGAALLVEGIHEALLHNGTQAVDVPRNQSHRSHLSRKDNKKGNSPLFVKTWACASKTTSGALVSAGSGKADTRRASHVQPAWTASCAIRAPRSVVTFVADVTLTVGRRNYFFFFLFAFFCACFRAFS